MPDDDEDEMVVDADVVSVLIVDDQVPFRLAARAVLRRTEGFELVGEAADGDEAVEPACASCGRASCSWTSTCRP